MAPPATQVELTAAALQRRNIDFAISGRNADKLKSLSAQTGSPEIRVVPPGDVQALTDALQDVKTLITCVGPFIEYGDTAIEAAIRAGVHYVDSTGEGTVHTEADRRLRRPCAKPASPSARRSVSTRCPETSPSRSQRRI